MVSAQENRMCRMRGAERVWKRISPGWKMFCHRFVPACWRAGSMIAFLRDAGGRNSLALLALGKPVGLAFTQASLDFPRRHVEGGDDLGARLLSAEVGTGNLDEHAHGVLAL